MCIFENKKGETNGKTLGVGNMRRIIASVISIVMPGGGQIYNRQFIKGFVFFFLEHIINYLAFINKAIYLDFNGYRIEALNQVNYQFALFYPGIYVLGVYDAYRNAKIEDVNSNAAIFFIIGGLLGTFSIVYSNHLPFPLLLGGLSMCVPILIGVVLYRQ
ncbi:MAG TPA: hypothetical protein VEZ38_16050 [Paenibacillus sp.]|nr:hypothetical protein [Paenibacillus sp.]